MLEFTHQNMKQWCVVKNNITHQCCIFENPDSWTRWGRCFTILNIIITSSLFRHPITSLLKSEVANSPGSCQIENIWSGQFICLSSFCYTLVRRRWGLQSWAGMWRRSAFSGLLITDFSAELDSRSRLGCSRSLGCWCGSFRAVRLNHLMQGKTFPCLHSNHAARPRLVIWLWRKPEIPKLPRGSIYWGMRELLSSWTFTWSQTTIGLPPPLNLNKRATKIIQKVSKVLLLSKCKLKYR